MPSIYPKPNGVRSREKRWQLVEWRNTNAAIAAFMGGITKEAVRHMRKKFNQPPWPRGGKYHPPYRPLTAGQIRRRGLKTIDAS